MQALICPALWHPNKFIRLQDWHGNAITESTLVQGFVTVRIARNATGAVTLCSTWAAVPAHSAWQCTTSGDALTAAGTYTLTLESSAPEASGWIGEQYERQFLVLARPEVDASATAAAIQVSPWTKQLTAGVYFYFLHLFTLSHTFCAML
jgi:hypothetical protein